MQQISDRLVSPSPLQIGAVTNGLNDPHPYPRKTAALGVLKIYDLDKESLFETEILPTIRKMVLTDQNAATVANCVTTLIEIDGANSLATKKIVYGLINRIKDFTEWSQVTILKVTSLYKCKDKTETFDVMNALEDRLSHSNSAVVLATVKCFLRATTDLPDVHQQVFERMKAPLLTLAQTDQVEPGSVVWAHLHLLTLRAPSLFANEYKSFYIRVSDPPSVKKLKIEMLTAVADFKNTYEICDELSEYVGDVDVSISRCSIRAIANIALDGDRDATGPIVDRLTQFVHHGAPYVVAETLVSLVLVTRKFSNFIDHVVSSIANLELDDIEDSDGKQSLLYMLGTFGEFIPHAPYLLEPALDAFQEESSCNVKCELLTSAMKLFFKRPPEMKTMLGKVLQTAQIDTDQDVHDLSLLYTRLLLKDVHAAERVVSGVGQGNENKRPEIARFYDANDLSEKFSSQIFDEFNTLSVVYRKPAFMFAVDEKDVMVRAPSAADLVGVSGVSGGSATQGASTAGFASDSLIDFGGENVVASRAPGDRDANLLDLMDVPQASGMSGIYQLAGLEGMAPTAPIAQTPTPLTLHQAPQMDPGVFQTRWGSLAATPGCANGAITLVLGQGAVSLTSPAPLVECLASKRFTTIASGGDPTNGIKIFAHAACDDLTNLGGQCVFLAELVVHPAARKVFVTIKSDANHGLGNSVERELSAVLQGFGG